MSIWQISLVAISTICFVSFGWAILFHFERPSSGTSLRMLALSLCGGLFFVLQIYSIIFQSTLSSFASEWVILRFAFSGLFFLVSLWLFWWTVSTTRKHAFALAFSSDGIRGVNAPIDLVVTGPYRFVRHPFYLSYLIYWVAGVLASGRAWTLVSVIVMYVFYLTAAKSEERGILGGPMAAHYTVYSGYTGTFLPKLYFSTRHFDRTIHAVNESKQDEQ